MNANRSMAAWKALASTPRLGPKTLVTVAIRLAESGSSGANLLGATRQELMEAGVPAAVADDAANRLAASPGHIDLPEGVWVLTPDDPDYPRHRLTRELPLPMVVYGRGQRGLLGGRTLVIAGSRSAPPTLLAATVALAEAAVRRDWTVVSGHAQGVDRAAHTAAVEASGTTVAVAAEGVDRLRLDQALLEALATSVAVISAYPLGTPWASFRAMERNTAIAALSDAAVVMAAGDSGGSLAQGRLCLEVDKPLYVPDVPAQLASGNRRLIAEGAIPFDPHKPAELLDEIELGEERPSASLQMGLFEG